MSRILSFIALSLISLGACAAPQTDDSGGSNGATSTTGSSGTNTGTGGTGGSDDNSGTTSPTAPTPAYAGHDLSVLGTIALDGGQTVSVTGDQIYNILGEPGRGSGTSVLEGILFSSSENIYYAFGTYDADTETMTLTHTFGTVSDGIRIDKGGAILYGDGDYASGTGRVSLLASDIFGLDYSARSGLNPGFVAASGVIGISTVPDQMPTTGTAQYTTNRVDMGVRDGDFAGTQILLDVNVLVDADFANGEVDFRITPNWSGPSKKFDYVLASDLPITGNAFVGKTIDAYSELSDGFRYRATFLGVPADIVKQQAAGLFFGPVNGAPAEVGAIGIITTTSNDEITFSFVAD
jgi:hypothetical protein